MSFSSKFKALTILLALAVCYPYAAASKSGKIRYAVGERNIIDEKGSERQAKQGAKVKEKELVKTGIESQVVISLPDGSSISVEENSLVQFLSLTAEDGKQTAMTDIKHGKVKFDAQRQNDGSTFRFKTGTATAAIRGTDGMVGMTQKGKAAFALNTGKLDIDGGDGCKVSIEAGEIAFSDGKCFKKIKSDKPGDKESMDKLMILMDDSTATADSIESKLRQFNEALKTIAAKVQKSPCTFANLPEIVDTNSVTISGSCEGNVNLLISDAKVDVNGGKVTTVLDWQSKAIGTKKFNITCIDTLDVAGLIKDLGIPEGLVPESKKRLGVSYTCGQLSTIYQPKIDSAELASKDFSFEVAAIDNDEICTKGSATIKGTYTKGADTTAKASITFAIGKNSETIALAAASGPFEHTLSINDINGNWNANDVVVTYTVNSKSIAKVLPISVNKSCSAINTKKPTLVVTEQTLNKGCSAKFSVGDLEDDAGIVTITEDATPQKEVIVNGNTSGIFKTRAGTHNYQVEAKDQAGNSVSVSQNISCYPKNKVAIEVDRKTQNMQSQRLRVPPAPKGHANILYRTMHFTLKNVPANDPGQIKSIVVKQEGGETTTLLNLHGANQIDRLDYDVQVSLVRDESVKTKVTITVEMYYGNIVSITKTFEVH
ncbi:FecR domain-containing protein [Fibrobacter sp.]|uniref:FecR family protein n=1 Tax=Fibrobacter sp. TaxID=35828 RepID=UPI00388FB1FB